MRNHQSGLLRQSIVSCSCSKEWCHQPSNYVIQSVQFMWIIYVYVINRYNIYVIVIFYTCVAEVTISIMYNCKLWCYISIICITSYVILWCIICKCLHTVQCPSYDIACINSLILVDSMYCYYYMSILKTNSFQVNKIILILIL